MNNGLYKSVLIGIALLFAAVPSRAALLLNGSFETNTDPSAKQPTGSTAITNWVTTLDGVEYFKPSDITNGVARDGLWIVDLAYLTSSNSGGIEQALTLELGQEYEISFSLGTRQANGRSGTAIIELTINGQIAQAYNVQNLTAGFVYDDLAYRFVASTETTTIGFQNRQNANLHFAYVDHVGLIEVPEPAAATALLALIGLLASGRRCRQASA